MPIDHLINRIKWILIFPNDVHFSAGRNRNQPAVGKWGKIGNYLLDGGTWVYIWRQCITFVLLLGRRWKFSIWSRPWFETERCHGIIQIISIFRVDNGAKGTKIRSMELFPGLRVWRWLTEKSGRRHVCVFNASMLTHAPLMALWES